MIKRRKTIKISVGDLFIGGDAPILVQSMTNTATADVDATIEQIYRLKDAGCELVRCGVPDMEAASALGEIVRRSPIPVAADIHFDWRLAEEAVKRGVHKLRINPGNFLKERKLPFLAELCRKRGIPIRIGVNGGSLKKSLYDKYGALTAEAMVESAMEEIALLEDCGFEDIIISLKSSSVPLTVEAYRQMAEKSDYPLHLGITEAGTAGYGSIKSAAGLGILLYEGIGDTVRVSLTAPPEEEISVVWDLLKALEIRRRGPEIISCPTCARTEIDVMGIARKVEEMIRHLPFYFRVAVMGCVVNGPGEAREAHVGIAGGKGRGVVFRNGRKIRTVDEDELLSALMDEIEVFLKSEFNATLQSNLS